MSSTKDTILNGVNYANVDFESLRQDLISLIPRLTPEWTNANDTDLGITLVNVFCGIADMLAYYLDEQARETYLPLARLRQSVIDITKLIGYRLARPTSASVDIVLEFTEGVQEPFTINKYDVFTTANNETQFVAAQDVVVLPGTTSVTVPLLQGVPKVEQFISDGNRIQRYPLSSNMVSENMLEVTVGVENEPYYELQKDVYLVNNRDRNFFQVYTDALDNTEIVFSEVFGKVPLEGQIITVRYLETVGEQGMIGAGFITKALDPNLLPKGTVIKQPKGARNGAPREDIEFARIQAPLEIRTLWRAVTPEDYKTLIDGYPGVLTSNVFDHETDPEVPIHQVVCVVAPNGGGELTTQFKEDLLAFLRRVRMTTVDVVIKSPDYVEWSIEANVYVKKGYNPDQVALDVINKLKEEFGLSKSSKFGDPVRFSKIVTVIQGVQGVSYVDMVTPKDDILITPYQLAVLGEPNVRVAGVV